MGEPLLKEKNIVTRVSVGRILCKCNSELWNDDQHVLAETHFLTTRHPTSLLDIGKDDPFHWGVGVLLYSITGTLVATTGQAMGFPMSEEFGICDLFTGWCQKKPVGLYPLVWVKVNLTAACIECLTGLIWIVNDFLETIHWVLIFVLDQNLLWNNVSYVTPQYVQWIGLRDNLQESPMNFMGKSMVSD